jgi:hypothetical protein
VAQTTKEEKLKCICSQWYLSNFRFSGKSGQLFKSRFYFTFSILPVLK